MIGYLTRGFRRSLLEPLAAPERGETVVLVHGLLHRSWVMLDLADFLRRHGYRVLVYDYPTTRHDVRSHGLALQSFLRKRLPGLPETDRISFIGHSMGGLLLRVALGDETLVPAARRGKLLLLGVPHGGSPVAAGWMARIPRLAPILVKPLPELSAPIELPEPKDWAIGSIFGHYDRKVPADSSAYAGESARCGIPCGHAFMMNRPGTREEILYFLDNGAFRRCK